MKLNDAVWGALLLLLAAAILVHVQSFGTIPGQQYGPAIFPGLLACGLAICAVLLIVNGLTARTPDGGRVRWMTLAIHTAFYKLLKVPLPWGLLEKFIW